MSRLSANAFGGLDFVWNHLSHPGPASVEGIEMADFALAVDLNLRSQIVTNEAALPELRARGGGGLLHTASTSGLVGSQFSRVYSAVKFGVVGFVWALAKRVAKDKIRVNAVCPGATDTPMLRVFVASPTSSARRAWTKSSSWRSAPARTRWVARPGRRRSPTPRSSCCPMRPRSSPARRCRSTA